MKRAILITWAFASVVALLNLTALWPLIVTPLALMSFGKWMGFLAVPFGCAVAAAVLAFAIRRHVVLVNLVFWLAFFTSAEVWRKLSMVDTNLAESAVCFEQHGFFRSLTFAGHEYQFDVHAAYVMEDRVMLWSYAETAYWEAPREAYRNLDFAACRHHVQVLLENTND